MATAFVQDAQNFVFGAGTCDVAYGSNVGLGNLICGGLLWLSSTITLTSVTLKSGSSATISAITLVENPITSFSASAAMWYGVVTGAGSLTLTATWSLSAIGGMVAHEASGLDPTSPFVDSNMVPQTDPGSGTDALDSGTITTGDYIFGFFCDATIEATTFTAGTGFTGYTNGFRANTYFSEYKTSGATKATGTWTSGSADAFSGGMSFKVASATQTLDMWNKQNQDPPRPKRSFVSYFVPHKSGLLVPQNYDKLVVAA